MDSGDYNILVVRKSGPIKTMKLRNWWLILILISAMLGIGGLGFGGYLLYQQNQSLSVMKQGNNLLKLRTERLESLVQERGTRALLAQQEADESAAVQAASREKTQKIAAKAKPAEVKKPETAASGPSSNKLVDPNRELVQGPQESDVVEIRNIHPRRRGNDLVISFDVANKQESKGQIMGYVTVLLRGTRKNKPWIEAWPPMRLSPLGRPLNFKRGTPFAVARFRRLRAAFAQNDKDIKRLEFLVYSRKGEIILITASNKEGKKISSRRFPGPRPGEMG